MVHLAGIDVRTDGSRIVQTFSRTDDWLWIASAPPVRLDAAAPDAELVAAVREALANSEIGIERPERLERLMDSTLRVAGVRSQRAYYAGTLSVGVEEDGGRFRIEPRRRNKLEFTTIDDCVIVLEAPDDETLASAIRRAIELSE